MSYDLEWVAGVICVAALVVAALALIGLGFWDVFRQRKGSENLSITASQWYARFFMRHPVAAFSAGIVLGILAGHFMWAQVVRVC